MSRPALVGLFVAGLGALGFAVEGPWGAAAVSIAVTLVVAMIARVTVPGPVRPAPGSIRDAPAPDFPSHRRISSMLSWSTSNGHYFDAVTRPFLRATAAALLADRCRVDLAGDTDAAAQRLGSDVLTLLDPTVVHDTTEPVDLQAIAAIVDQLEEL